MRNSLNENESKEATDRRGKGEGKGEEEEEGEEGEEIEEDMRIMRREYETPFV